ncbi:hypothetical protein [Pedobacter rhizosphaerae]|uniref:ParB-like nuclease domain-containing protein n=1 Tax=Pedobacter rhizosphaerae TaxID=390241 RepID=A0A1H9T2E9_9SPHI|nr:hypothetical protein [Pedobacter rhizosphaerae]SER91318.1 hypothetical protein SAMN04488023_12058 [Pedobacter rhizosphaerae]
MPEAAQFRSIPLGELFLDPVNPRLPKSMHNKSEQEILEYMLLDASLVELMLAIGTNGYFPGEQLLVAPEGAGFKVIEGNRRLSAVKLLNNPELATVQRQKIEQVMEDVDPAKIPNEIPCLIFSNENEIHNYLGYRHITGVKEWKLLEKARYLYGLKTGNFNSLSMENSSREIAKMIGSRTDYVRRVLVGFEVYKNIEDQAFYRIRGLDDTSFYFNYIADSLNKNNIVAFLGVDFSHENPVENLEQDNLKQWTSWLFEKNSENVTRLNGSSSNLNKLNSILGNGNATKAFVEGMPLDRAFELTEDLSEIFRKAITSSLSNLEQADSIVHRVNDFYSGAEEDLLTIRKLTTKIKNSMDSAADERF